MGIHDDPIYGYDKDGVLNDGYDWKLDAYDGDYRERLAEKLNEQQAEISRLNAKCSSLLKLIQNVYMTIPSEHVPETLKIIWVGAGSAGEVADRTLAWIDEQVSLKPELPKTDPLILAPAVKRAMLKHADNDDS